MNDDFATEPLSTAQPRERRARILVPALLAILLLAAAAGLWAAARAGWLSWQGWRAPPVREAQRPPAAPVPQRVTVIAPDQQAQAALGVRLAELEQRMARLGSQADVVAENASRAERLMIAFAVRRAIERGLPLGYLEGQLKLRFGDARPNAVATLIEASNRPVTREQLLESLDRLAPVLVDAPPEEGTLARMRHEIGNLFIIRKASAPSPQPQRRLGRARSLLENGRVDAAINEVNRLPGRQAAAAWLQSAQRYLMAERALDLIETAALLEPQREIVNQEAPPAPSVEQPIPAPESPAPESPPPVADPLAGQTG